MSRRRHLRARRKANIKTGHGRLLFDLQQWLRTSRAPRTHFLSPAPCTQAQTNERTRQPCSTLRTHTSLATNMVTFFLSKHNFLSSSSSSSSIVRARRSVIKKNEHSLTPPRCFPLPPPHPPRRPPHRAPSSRHANAATSPPAAAARSPTPAARPPHPHPPAGGTASGSSLAPTNAPTRPPSSSREWLVQDPRKAPRRVGLVAPSTVEEYFAILLERDVLLREGFVQAQAPAPTLGAITGPLTAPRLDLLPDVCEELERGEPHDEGGGEACIVGMNGKMYQKRKVRDEGVC